MKISLNRSYSFTQLGKRENQEDSRYPDKDVASAEQNFFVVCDGVGGEEKGEVASRTVCNAIASFMEDYNPESPFVRKDFEQVLRYAYKRLKDASRSGNEEMATTLTFIAFHSNGCLAAHIGDSRIYQIRPGYGIVYRSSDHSLMNSLVHTGFFSPDEVKAHPDKNMITRAMCVPDAEREQAQAATVLLRDIDAGDYFFLCTDGVLEQLTENRLLEILELGLPDNEKLALIKDACKGSDDNHTAYLVPVAKVEKNEEEQQEELTEASMNETEDSVVTHIIVPDTPIVEDTECEPSHSWMETLQSTWRKLFGK